MQSTFEQGLGEVVRHLAELAEDGGALQSTGLFVGAIQSAAVPDIRMCKQGEEDLLCA